MTVVVFLLLNIAVLFSALSFSAWLNKKRAFDLGYWLLSSFVLYCSSILIIEIILGILGQLNLFALCLATFIFSTITLLFTWKEAWKALKLFWANSFSKEQRKYFKLFLIGISPMFFLLTVRAFNVSLQMPLEQNAVVYHLPFVVEWMQTGSLMQIYYSAFSGPLGNYPSNYELLDLWFMLPFQNDFFANLLNFPLYAVLALGLYETAKKMGLGAKLALACSMAPFYMPVFIRQAGIPLVDLFFAICFLLCVYFSFDFFKKPKSGSALLFGLSLGLFVGTKYLGLIYGAPLFALFLVTLFAQRKSVGKASHLILASLGVFLTGSFFYIRNWILDGNPLFPVEISLLDHVLFEGYGSDNAKLENTSLLHNVRDLGSLKIFIKEYFYMTGPLGLASIAAPVFYGMSFFKKGFYKKYHKALLLGLFLSLASLLYFALYFKAPYTHRDLLQNVRYSLPFLLLGLLNIALLLKLFTKPSIQFFVFATVFAYSFPFLILDIRDHVPYASQLLLDWPSLWKHVGLFVLCSSSALFFVAAWVWRLKKRNIAALNLLLCFVLGVSSFTLLNEKRFELMLEYPDEHVLGRSFGRGQKHLDAIAAANWINKNAPEANIAYSGLNYHYHFFGPHLSRQVDYVNINECLECRYADYKHSPKSIRRDADFGYWLNNLRALNKDYLVVNPEIVDTYNYEYAWAEVHPEIFKRVFEKNDTFIYAIQ